MNKVSILISMSIYEEDNMKCNLLHLQEHMFCILLSIKNSDAALEHIQVCILSILAVVKLIHILCKQGSNINETIHLYQ